MTALVEGIITQVGPSILTWAFGVLEEKLGGDVKGGPNRAIAPIVAEMMEHAQKQVMLYGIPGVMDEHGRLVVEFRAPYEARLLETLKQFGFVEGA